MSRKLFIAIFTIICLTISGCTLPVNEMIKKPVKVPVKKQVKEPVKEPTKEPTKEPVKKQVKENDVRQIRKVLISLMVGHHKFDPEQILSCFAPEFVAYTTLPAQRKYKYQHLMKGDYSIIIDPEDWTVQYASLGAYRKWVEKRMGELKREPVNPNIKHFDEVHNVHIWGSQAIAVTEHGQKMFCPITRETIHTWNRSVWMLAKIKGKWKITGYIGAVDMGRNTTKK